MDKSQVPALVVCISQKIIFLQYWIQHSTISLIFSTQFFSLIKNIFVLNSLILKLILLNIQCPKSLSLLFAGISLLLWPVSSHCTGSVVPYKMLQVCSLHEVTLNRHVWPFLIHTCSGRCFSIYFTSSETTET